MILSRSQEAQPDGQVRSLAKEAFDRAQAGRSAVVVVVLGLDDRERIDAPLAEQARRQLCALVAGQLSGVDGFLFHLDQRLCLVLPGDLEQVAARIDQLVDLFGQVVLDGPGGARQLSISAGLACNRKAEPAFDPGLCLQVLEQVAEEGRHVASEGGGGRVAHSELYGFVQAGLARRRPQLCERQARRVESLARGGAAPQHTPAPIPAPRREPAPPVPKPARRPDGTRTILPVSPARQEPIEPELEPRTTPQYARPQGSAGISDGPLGGAVHELLAGLEAGAADLGLVERSLEAILAQRLEQERQRAGEVAERSYGLQVDRLERRLSKLNASLEQTEARLARDRGDGHQDPGAASSYRVVQGIELGDDQLEHKRQLMAQIFAANLEFQERAQEN